MGTPKRGLPGIFNNLFGAELSTFYLKTPLSLLEMQFFSSFQTMFPIQLFVSPLLGSLFSPPPASVGALGWSGQLFWLTVLLAYRVDRHRVASGETPPASTPSIS